MQTTLREGQGFTDEELEEMFKEAEEEEPEPRPLIGSPWFRRTVGIGLVLMLCVQVLAFWPQIYSLAAIRFLTVSAQLSQSEAIQNYKQSVVEIRTDGTKGTGFIISSDGYVVTNRHVVGDAKTVVISIPDRGSHVGDVVAQHEDVDLALIKLEVQDMPSLSLAQRFNGEVGIPIYVIGNPLFFSGIANVGETWGLLARDGPSMLVLQAPIYKGNSGSPVMTQDGDVIGVVYATMSIQRDGTKHKVGLAVPVEWVHDLIR